MLKEKYENIVNKYTQKFERKFDVEFSGWIGNQIGGINEVADMFLNFDDIRLVIDNKISFKDLSNWYWFMFELAKVSINLSHYIRFKQDYLQYCLKFKHSEFHNWLFIKKYI